MNKSSASEKPTKGKSKAQSSLEATLQGTTRRFSAFAELGIPSVDPQVEGIRLEETQEAAENRELPPSQSSPRPTVSDDPPVLGDVLCELPLHVIVPNPHQPRFLENTEANDRLLHSIKNSGVIQPIIVRRKPGSETYELIAGERRWRACQEIGKSTIPAIIRKADSNQSAAESLIENLVREDLSPLEESKAYQRLIDDHGFSQTEIADRTGVTPGRISQLLKLLSLPSDIQDLLYNSETPKTSPSSGSRPMES
jgi:ParB/RepB/Spo0J family partition protein